MENVMIVDEDGEVFRPDRFNAFFHKGSKSDPPEE